MNKENPKNQTLKISDNLIRVIVYGFIFIVFAIIWCYNPLKNYLNIQKAENCFKAEKYACAFKGYYAAFSTNMDNSKYVKNYFETLSKMKKIALVQEELVKLLEYYPDSEVTLDIEQIFAEIKNSLPEKYQNTYIDVITQGNNVVHWNNIDSDIKFYIEVSSEKLPNYYYEEVVKAFNDYSRLMNNAIKFTNISNKQDAHIVVTFMPEISGGKCAGNNDCLHVLGLTETDIAGSVLRQVSVKLRTKDTDDTQFTANQIHNIAKHEIGHALGIAGHSYYPDDVMYPVNNDAEWAENTATLIITRKDFSSRDKQTMELLYKIIPDITNISYQAKAHSDMYYPIAVLGTQREIGERKLEESARYIKEVSSSFIAQMALAESYFVSKNMVKAKETFEQALQLANTDEEKFTVYYNLAVIEYEQSNYADSINYANLANSYSLDNGSNEIKAYSLMEMKKYQQAENILEKLVKKDPENETYSANLVSTYLKQYKFGKMFTELKRIKAIKPNVFNDAKFAQYRLLEGLL